MPFPYYKRYACEGSRSPELEGLPLLISLPADSDDRLAWCKYSVFSLVADASNFTWAPPKKELTKKEKRAEWYNNMGLIILILFCICLFLLAVVAAVCAIINESIPGELAENVLKIAIYVVGGAAALLFIWVFLGGVFDK